MSPSDGLEARISEVRTRCETTDPDPYDFALLAALEATRRAEEDRLLRDALPMQPCNPPPPPPPIDTICISKRSPLNQPK